MASRSNTRNGAGVEGQVKAPRFCRFEDHRHDRDTKTWIPLDGELRMCPNLDCTYAHRVDRPEACEQGLNCTNYNCGLLHPVKRQKPCRFGGDCVKQDCKFAHSEARLEPCPYGGNCYDYIRANAYEYQDDAGPGCELGHPYRMNRICRHDTECHLFGCKFLHGYTASRDCPDGGQCQRQRGSGTSAENICQNKHPKYTRMMVDSNGSQQFS